MRILMLALLAASAAGCVVQVDENGNLVDDPPPPAPGPTAAVKEAESESHMVKYRKRVPEVYEGIKLACRRLNLKPTEASTPGEDNWTVKGVHASGGFDFSVYMNRHDHKTQTTVTISSPRMNQFQCREWTRRFHAEIAKEIGE